MPDAPAASPAPASAAPAQQAAPTTASASPAATPAATTTPTTTPTQSTPTAPAAGSETKPATTPAEAKPQETKPEQTAAIELKLPKDSLLPADAVKAVADFAKANGLKPDAAQALLENQSAAVAAHQARLEAQHREQVQAWDKSLTKDKDIGGDAIKANLEMGRRALEKYGSPELIEALRSTGYNSFPPLVKFMVQIGKAMGEDRIASGKTGTEANDMRSIYKSMPNA